MNSLKTLSIRRIALLLVFSLLIAGLSACGTTKTSRDSGEILKEKDTETTNLRGSDNGFEDSDASVDEANNTFPLENFNKIKSKLALLLGCLWAYDDDTGKIDYFKMDEFKNNVGSTVIDSYLCYSYLHTLDDSIWKYDYDKKTISGDLSSLKDLFRFFFGSDLNEEDVTDNISLQISDNKFTFNPRPFSYLLKVSLIASEKTSKGYMLVLNSEEASEDFKYSYSSTWKVQLKRNKENQFGYEVISVERVIPDNVLKAAPLCIKDNFSTMEDKLADLLYNTGEPQNIIIPDIPNEKIASILHTVAFKDRQSDDGVFTEKEVKKIIRDYFGSSASVPRDDGGSGLFTYKDGVYSFIEATGADFGTINPVYIKTEDDFIYMYVNHMGGFFDPDEYIGTWEIVFEKDEESDLGCHLVSLTPIIDSDINEINENYLLLIEELKNNNNTDNSKLEDSYISESSDPSVIYSRFLDNKEYMDYMSESIGISYAFKDIDEDDCDELIIRNHISEFENYSFYIFSIEDDSVKYLDSELASGSYYEFLYYSASNYAIIPYFRMSDSMSYYFFNKNEDSITKSFELHWERDFSPEGKEVSNYYYVENENYELIHSDSYGIETGDISGWSERISDFEEIPFVDI